MDVDGESRYCDPALGDQLGVNELPMTSVATVTSVDVESEGHPVCNFNVESNVQNCNVQNNTTTNYFLAGNDPQNVPGTCPRTTAENPYAGSVMELEVLH